MCLDPGGEAGQAAQNSCSLSADDLIGAIEAVGTISVRNARVVPLIHHCAVRVKLAQIGDIAAGTLSSNRPV